MVVVFAGLKSRSPSESWSVPNHSKMGRVRITLNRGAAVDGRLVVYFYVIPLAIGDWSRRWGGSRLLPRFNPQVPHTPWGTFVPETANFIDVANGTVKALTGHGHTPSSNGEFRSLF